MPPQPSRTLLAATMLALVGVGSAQAATGEPIRPRTAVAERTGRSVAARALPPDERPVVTHRRPNGGAAEVSNPPLRRFVPGVGTDRDAALARRAIESGQAPSPGAVQFDGLANSHNAAEFGFTIYPPDTNHDVGPAHIVETTNLLVRVYDKTGAPLTAPFRMSTLFAPLGGICSTNDEGDPVVLYDPLADRWLLSQFAFTDSGPQAFVTHECIAISTSGDPTGDYHLYDFFGPNTSVFGDYPHLGVWPDGYYMTTNQFNTAGNAFLGTGAFVFERERMLAGDPAARVLYLDLAVLDPTIGGMLPADFDGLRPPPAGMPNTFAYFVATEFGDATDGLRLFDFQVDWETTNNSFFAERSESPLAVAAFSPLTPNGRDDILQPGGTCTSALDAIGDRLMHRLQYRNLGATEGLVLNHTVNANGSTNCSVGGTTFQAGVRLYQLARPTGAVNAFAIAQQMTHAPEDEVSRWMASAAADHQNNLAVGFSAAGKTLSPSIRYTGRLASDPANTLQVEATMIAGTASQTATGSRWGDYSMLAVDPVDDCTFWYSQEYYTLASAAGNAFGIGWLTRIGSFKFPSCSGSPRGSLEVTVTDCNGGSTVAGAAVEAEGGYFRTTDAEGLAQFAAVHPGAYDVFASVNGVSSAPAEATIVDGETETLGICLDFSLFADGFESTDVCEWSAATGAPACP